MGVWEEDMTSELLETFNGNILVGFIVSVIVIASYTNLKETQQMLLIYLLTFGLAVFKVIRIRFCIILLLIATIVFIEALTDDKEKLEMLSSGWCKTLDYVYLMLVQYRILVFVLSLVLLYLSHICEDVWTYIFLILSIISLVICEHLVVTQPFKVKTISELLIPFNTYPYYLYHYDDNMRIRYEMVSLFEDKTFFLRENSYSVFSLEYLQLKSFRGVLKKAFSQIRNNRQTGGSNLIIKSLLSRGYSTPEMQLVRTIGVVRGYDKHKYLRKIYEIFYSRILFSSLKKYQVDNSGPSVKHFREYILDIYLKNVLISVNEKRIPKLNSIFADPENVQYWPMEGLFVACLGLSQRYVNEYQIGLYYDVIEKYKLDINIIYEYAQLIENDEKIPCVKL